MENIPKWFWIALGAIALITVICFIMGNRNKVTLPASNNEIPGDLNAIDDANSLQFL